MNEDGLDLEDDEDGMQFSELDELHVSTSTFFRTRLMIWCVRWAITITLYYFFWEYEWVRWTLVVAVPLGLLSLGLILVLQNEVKDIKREHGIE